MKISVLMSTVRNNFPMLDCPGVFIFDPIIKSLQQQTFKDFEFVLMDYRKDIRNGLMKSDYGFAFKHERPKRSVWDDMRFPAIYNGFNSAIMHADGELCILLGDCCEISDNFLEVCWEWYNKDRFVAGLVEARNPIRHKLLSRNPTGNCPVKGRIATWGYNSYSLDALFKVNGFDENFDGTNHRGDDDIGARLALAGYKFVLDGRMRAKEFRHYNPSIMKDYVCGKQAKDNRLYYDFKWQHAPAIRANDGTIDTLGFKGYENKDYKSVKPHYNSIEEYRTVRDVYIKHPSRFNLKQLWEERRGKSLGRIRKKSKKEPGSNRASA